MAKIVLLGAGASFGSSDVTPHPPPLGGALFNELLSNGGEAASLPEEIKVIFQENFEEGMAKYYDYTNGNIMSFQRELSGYLAKFKPGKDNTYRRLLEALGTKRVIYSSLNYDLLFEQSATDIGLNVKYDTANEKGAVRLLKIHGSSNFWPNLQEPFVACSVQCQRKVQFSYPLPK